MAATVVGSVAPPLLDATDVAASATRPTRFLAGVMLRAVIVALGTTMAAVALHGCAALPLAAVGGAMLESGAGVVVKTGTEYTVTGAAHRTFTVPANAVRAAVLEAFDRTGVALESQKQSDDKERIVGALKRRTVTVQLTAFSPALTGLTLVVKRNFLVKDRATTSELLEQVEQVLAENPTFARRLRRAPQDGVAASPP